MKAATRVIDSALKAIGHVTVTVGVAAVGLGVVPATAVMASVQVQDDNIRVWDDAVDPTATVGVYFEENDHIQLRGRLSIVNFRAIRDTAATGDAILAVHYWG